MDSILLYRLHFEDENPSVMLFAKLNYVYFMYFKTNFKYQTSLLWLCLRRPLLLLTIEYTKGYAQRKLFAFSIFILR